MMLLDQHSLANDDDRFHLERPRLERRLTELATAQITVLVGGAGSGKSAVLRTVCRDPRTFYYRVGSERATFARFVHGLAQTVAIKAPGAVASFPRAWERALQSDSPSAVLARWFCEHLTGIDRHLAIDDLHAAAADPSIASFITTLAELRLDAPLTMAVRSVGQLPIALWMATGRMERPIDETELRFNRAEVNTAAKRCGVTLADAELDALLAATGGSPIGIAYALAQFQTKACDVEPARAPATFEAIAERVFARRTARERRFLFGASLFAGVDDGVLVRAGWEDAAAVRAAMNGDAAVMWEHHPQHGFRFHDRFRDYLAGQFARCDPAFKSGIAGDLVRALTADGRYSDALEVATGQRQLTTIGTLLDAHGFAILESGEIDVIAEALAVLANSDASLGASTLALRGYIESRSGRLDTAEAWFRLGLDKAGDEASRVAIAMYYARELALRRREDACAVLEPFADSTTLPRSVLIDVRSAFAQALTAANRLDEATLRTREALALLESDSPPALRARVLARAAYVALESDSFVLARERATIAAPLAVAQCLYDVAASTYSVLYNVAYDIDDDAAACLQHLHRMRDLGAKSGTLRLDLYVMLARYELHAEAGDEAALAELDLQLASVDKHDANSEIAETLVPGKALRAAWIGDFDAARRLLQPTAHVQATPARKALRWAQIGLHCAALGDRDRALDAFANARDAHAQADGQTTKFSLTILTLALGTFIAGNVDEARRLLAQADAAIGAAPRLRALRMVIEAMVAGAADEDRFAQGVSSALGELWPVSFGGMAKLIEALPYPFGQPRSRARTIGSALAERELSARFSAAVVAQRFSALRDWLDTLPGSIFADVAITEQFERWAADNGDNDRLTRASVGDLRRALAVYRRPAPVLLRLVDDIDATIDTLFENLDLAAPLMAEHSRAVSAWCSRLGRILGLAEDEITFVTRCGLIHDIGKMRTPAEILQAPRQLTPREWAVMRDHTIEGGRIVSLEPLLAVFAPIVRGHHERLDGQGYPDGLRAGAIPLAARIVSVADSFNAMIGRRPYRLPMAPTEALGELERHRGTQFDPEVVDAMVRVVLGRLAPIPATKI